LTYVVMHFSSYNAPYFIFHLCNRVVK
jgi:hypothetical protein